MRYTIYNVWCFYIEGFRSMTVGRTLWIIILLKIFVIFFILRIFFFPNILGSQPNDKAKGIVVSNELIERATHSNP
ncbi:MAG: DUF4492 domain-containing protein [Bacteroidaceae bacterium]|nr:DUF4492 domain-containing protein [Bacteroidaceae bacterium]